MRPPLPAGAPGWRTRLTLQPPAQPPGLPPAAPPRVITPPPPPLWRHGPVWKGLTARAARAARAWMQAGTLTLTLTLSLPTDR